MVSLPETLGFGLPMLVGLSLIGLAWLVARSGLHVLHNRFFAALYLLSGVKSLGEGILADVNGRAVAATFHASSPLFPGEVVWVRVGEACGLAMLPLLFLFVVSFPRPTTWMVRRPWLGALAFLPSAAVGAVIFAIPYSVRLHGSDHRALLAFDVAVAFNVLSTLVTIVALVLLMRTRKRSPEAIERKQATYVTAGFIPSFLATWAITGLLLGYRQGLVDGATTNEWLAFILNNLSPLFEFLAASLVAFAILKYNIMGISPRFRIGVKSAAAGFLLVSVFLLTQVIENIILQGQVFSFAGEYGSFLLSGVVGLVLFKPINSISGRLSNRLLPKEDAPLGRAGEIYRAQATYVLRDAQVSDREMAFLRNLRGQLGLADAQAQAIEEQVERTLKVDSPRTGASSESAPPLR